MADKPTTNPDAYWASEPVKELGQSLTSRIKEQDLTQDHVLNAHAEACYRAHQYFYAATVADDDGRSSLFVTRDGDQDELAAIRVNEARSHALAQAQLITGAKIAWKCQSTNDDPNSQAAAINGDSLLEYNWKEQALSALCAQAVEYAIPYGEHFVFTPWNPLGGKAKAAVGGKQFQTGSIEHHSVFSWDVSRDSTCSTFEESEWFIVRRDGNRHSLKVLYPQQVKEILAAPRNCFDNTSMRGTTPISSNDDRISVYYFFHKRSPALPRGRELAFLGDGTPLVDPKNPEGHLTYREIPLHRMKAGDRAGTPYPYSSWWDSIAPQELSDSYQSSLATNITTLGSPIISAEVGSDLPVDQIAGGPKVIYRAPGSQPPVAINFTSASGDTFNHLDRLAAKQRQICGLNDVALGQTPGGTADMNASAMALLSSMAVQNNSRIQEYYVDFIKKLGRSDLHILEDRMTEPVKVSITGRNGQYESFSINKQDLAKIDSVNVEIANAMSQTSAGRFSTLELFHKMGLVKTPEQAQMVFDTGRLEPLTRELQKELMLISGENELLSQGQEVPVAWTENHRLHIMQHKGELSSISAKMNPQVFAAVNGHIMEHANKLAETPPELLMLTGNEPLPPPMAPPGVPVEAGGAPLPPGAISEPPGTGPADVKLPKNPLTNSTVSMTEPPINGG